MRIITNQLELKSFMAGNPDIALLPVGRKKLSKIMKLVTKSVELEESENQVLSSYG